MNNLINQAFQPLVNSSNSAFSSSALSTTSVNYALEATGTRQWQLPTSRSVRIHGMGSANFYVNFGSSTVTCGATNGILCGGEPIFFRVDPPQAYIAMYSSTSAIVNVALGHGKG